MRTCRAIDGDRPCGAPSARLVMRDAEVCTAGHVVTGLDLHCSRGRPVRVQQARWASGWRALWTQHGLIGHHPMWGWG